MDSITLDKRNSIVLSGVREDLSRARQFVAEKLQNSAFSERESHLLMLAVDEALSHIVTYSELTNDPHGVKLGVEVDAMRFVARIQDSRTDFMDLIKGSAVEDIRKKSSESQLGIYLIRQIVDEVKYTYHRGFENELVLLKFVSSD